MSVSESVQLAESLLVLLASAIDQPGLGVASPIAFLEIAVQLRAWIWVH
ncbi:hypothetical protein [Streptomonospora sediminis]